MDFIEALFKSVPPEWVTHVYIRGVGWFQIASDDDFRLSLKTTPEGLVTFLALVEVPGAEGELLDRVRFYFPADTVIGAREMGY